MLFNFEGIIRLFQKSGMGMGLTTATTLADQLLALHSERVITVENNAFESGRLAGYEKGYAAGKMDSDEYNRGYAAGRNDYADEATRRLEEIESRMIDIAGIEAIKIAKDNPREKIKAIKLLKSKTGLSFSQAKHLMDKAYMEIAND